MWYNYGRLFSYKALLNLIIGLRGGGKTYGAKKQGIRDFLRKGEQFVWVRRFNTELEEALKNFFGPLQLDEDLVKEFGEIEYKIEKNAFYINNKVAGMGMSLTSAGKFKSSEYPNVTKIFFDEFMIEDSGGYYLKNEVEVLFGLIETIQRLRDDVRVVLIGNSVSFTNPYFMYFKIKPFTTEFLHVKERSLVIHMYYNEKFANAKRNTRFGKLVQGTGYEAYAIDNKFHDLNDVFIEKKGKKVRFLCVVRYESIDYGFWIDDNKGLMYASHDVDTSNKRKYVLSEVEHDINYILALNYRGTAINTIIEYYAHGLLRFEDNLVKAGVTQILSII